MRPYAAQSRWAGPLETYPPPWWDAPRQRKRGPSYRLTPQEVRQLIRSVEYYIKRVPFGYGLEAADSSDLIEKIRQGQCISMFDGDMPQPSSYDSYNHFARKNPHMCQSRAELEARNAQARSAAQQITWEAEQRARREAKETEATRLWDAETSRRVMKSDPQLFWRRISKRFSFQTFVRVRTGHQNTRVRDEDDSWTVIFGPREYYTVPNEVADLLVRLGSSRQ